MKTTHSFEFFSGKIRVTCDYCNTFDKDYQIDIKTKKYNCKKCYKKIKAFNAMYPCPENLEKLKLYEERGE